MKCIKCDADIPDNSIFCNICGRKQIKEYKKGKKQRGNGTGSVFKLPNGKYRAVVTLGYSADGHRKQRTKSGFKTKKEALEYLPKLRGLPETNKIKFNKLYEMWKETHFLTIGKSKQQSYNTAYKRCSDLYFKNIDEIKLNDMQKLVDNCPGAYYPKQDIKVLLNNVMRYGVMNEYCKVNYAQYIKLPPLEKSKKTAFSDDEIKNIWKVYNNGNSFAGYILIMIYTGMRYGEIAIIKKDDIHINERYILGGIKTDAGKNRQILISEKIVPIIESIYSKCNNKLLEMSEEEFYNNFKSTLKEAGTRPLTPHCCRHTFATLMAKADVQPAIIKEAAGHANYSTTLEYTHIPLKTKLEAVNKI